MFHCSRISENQQLVKESLREVKVDEKEDDDEEGVEKQLVWRSK